MTPDQKLRDALGAAATSLDRAKDALNRDRTGLAAALEAVGKEVAGRYWMRPDGGWASYSWEEHTPDTLRKEIDWAFNAITKLVAGALGASGNLAGVEVNAANDAAHRARAALANKYGPACPLCGLPHAPAPASPEPRPAQCGAEHPVFVYPCHLPPGHAGPHDNGSGDPWGTP